MRILIVSDLHANLEAVRSLPQDYDEVWVLGDLVNYGPNPSEVIELVRRKASLVIRETRQLRGLRSGPQLLAPI